MGEWQERLKAAVPRTDIPAYLSELQALVAYLRRERDDLRIPDVPTVRARLSPLLVRHADLTVDYLDDPRYARVVQAALDDVRA